MSIFFYLFLLFYAILLKIFQIKKNFGELPAKKLSLPSLYTETDPEKKHHKNPVIQYEKYDTIKII